MLHGKPKGVPKTHKRQQASELICLVRHGGPARQQQNDRHQESIMCAEGTQSDKRCQRCRSLSEDAQPLAAEMRMFQKTNEWLCDVAGHQALTDLARLINQLISNLGES